MHSRLGAPTSSRSGSGSNRTIVSSSVLLSHRWDVGREHCMLPPYHITHGTWRGHRGKLIPRAVPRTCVLFSNMGKASLLAAQQAQRRIKSRIKIDNPHRRIAAGKNATCSSASIPRTLGHPRPQVLSRWHGFLASRISQGFSVSFLDQSGDASIRSRVSSVLFSININHCKRS